MWDRNELYPQWKRVDFHLIEQVADSTAIMQGLVNLPWSDTRTRTYYIQPGHCAVLHIHVMAIFF